MIKNRIKKIIKITKKDFFSNKKIKKIKNLVTDGNILILKSAFKDVTLRKIYKELVPRTNILKQMLRTCLSQKHRAHARTH